jgi:hypothetical protein
VESNKDTLFSKILPKHAFRISKTDVRLRDFESKKTAASFSSNII